MVTNKIEEEFDYIKIPRKENASTLERFKIGFAQLAELCKMTSGGLKFEFKDGSWIGVKKLLMDIWHKEK